MEDGRGRKAVGINVSTEMRTYGMGLHGKSPHILAHILLIHSGRYRNSWYALDRSTVRVYSGEDSLLDSIQRLLLLRPVPRKITMARYHEASRVIPPDLMLDVIARISPRNLSRDSDWTAFHGQPCWTQTALVCNRLQGRDSGKRRTAAHLSHMSAHLHACPASMPLDAFLDTWSR